MATPRSSSAEASARLHEWLSRCERLHPREVELGLGRVAQVKARLGLQFKAPLVVVGGTNGKGSSCALLEHMALAAGHRVGVYAKPHLRHFEERCRIGGLPVSADELLPHFEAVEQARQDLALTYFEFTTLVIARLLSQRPLDLVVLEVGLGGRLDAVNAFDADCALITGIDIDHVDWLGPDRESIGREKAGIFRPGRTAVLADPRPPASVLAQAQALGTPLWVAGVDFLVRDHGTSWDWTGPGASYRDLPRPALRGPAQVGNAAGVLALLQALGPRLPVPEAAVRQGLRQVRLEGRQQLVARGPRVLLDVAHNPQSVQALLASLPPRAPGGRLIAVFGCLADKAPAELLALLRPQVQCWHLCDLPPPRGERADALAQQLALGLAPGEAGAPVRCHATPQAALAAACEQAQPEDLVLVLGSFHTVGPCLDWLDETQAPGA